MKHITAKTYLMMVLNLEGACSVEEAIRTGESEISLRVGYKQGILLCNADIIGKVLHISKLECLGSEPSEESVKSVLTTICNEINNFEIKCLHISNNCFRGLYKILEDLEFKNMYTEIMPVSNIAQKYEYYKML